MNRREALRVLSSGVVFTSAGCLERKSVTPKGGYAVRPNPTCGDPQRTGTPQTIVDAGETGYCVSVSNDAPLPVHTAADELRHYVKRATGAELRKVNDSPRTHKIVLRVDETLTPCNGRRAEEAFIIEREESQLTVRGASPRGVLYGVYDILERDFGIRWVSPGPDGEHVPSIDSAEITPLHSVTMPDFGYRIAGNFHTTEYVRWAIRNRLHIPRWPLETDWPAVHQRTHPEVTKREGYVTAPTVHSFHNILPRETYQEEHPNWFSENQIDVTKESVVDAFVDKVRTFFYKYPSAKMCPITPNDGYGWSEAASSEDSLSAQSEAGHPTRVRHHLSVTEAYFRFVTKVANRVRRTHPEKLLYSIAYINYVYPPVTFPQLPRNVVVSVCHYAPADYAHPIGSDVTDQSEEFASILSTWATKTANPWMYAYTVKYALDALPQPIAYRLGEDIEYLYTHGYTGFYSQGAENRWGQYGPHFYVMAKKLWDHSRSVSDILTEYFKLMAGDGWRRAKRAYDTLATAMRNVPHKVDRHPMQEARPYLSPEIRSAVERDYRLASRAASTKTAKRNIRAMQIPITYASLYFRMRDALQAYASDGIVEDLKNAVAARNEIRELIISNSDIDSLPHSLIQAEGYFTLRNYFEKYMDKIDTAGGRWRVS
ncbi:DUF4838 domain-containing protein [Halobaculum sp. EA56]|uniref:DUF4838 domain-containing protein n=1 Tax=Halobaculum sp. EA56 TaxID=3421648 RepID=UPI003EB974C3